MRNDYPRLILYSVMIGLAGGAFTVVYLLVVEGGTEALWGAVESTSWFGGTWRALVIPVVAGVLVGILYRVLGVRGRFAGFIAELEEGEVEPRRAGSAVLVAIVSLIGGAALGPEAPLGTGAGAAGTWLARRTGGDDARVRALTFAGMSAAFGSLVSSPIVGPLLAFELEHEQTEDHYLRHLIPGVVSGAVGFGVAWPIIGAPFLALFDLPPTEFESWMLLAAVAIGVAGAALAMVTGKIVVATVTLMRRLDDRPLLRGTIGGVGVASVGFAVPLSLFSGQDGLAVVIEAVEPGILLLVGLILAKALALGLSLGGGFYGGPIFPIFFIGGVFGVLINVLFPAIPIGLAVGGAMAALGSAAAAIPISVAILASLLIQANFLMAGAVVVAATTAFALKASMTPRPSDAARASAA